MAGSENIYSGIKYSGIKRVIISEDEIKQKVKEAGEWVSKEYEGKPLLLISILNGAFVFMADFCREVKIPCEIAFMCAKSYYSGTVSAGEVNVTMDVSQDISGYHVIIVEDIMAIETSKSAPVMVEVRSDRDINVLAMIPAGKPVVDPLTTIDLEA